MSDTKPLAPTSHSTTTNGTITTTSSASSSSSSSSDNAATINTSGKAAMKRPTKLQIMVLVAYAINAFFTFVPMDGKWTNGCTNSNQSDKYFTIITPPGWAFAIWGLIFLWEAAACVIAFVPQWQQTFSGLIVDRTFVAFWGLACVLQSVWPIVFCDAVESSWFILLLVWVSLLCLQQSSLRKLAFLKVGDTAEVASANPEATTTPTKVVVTTKTKVLLYLGLIAPFSLHLGWVTAAAALNVNLSTVASMNSPYTLTTVALSALVGVTAMGWTFGVTGMPWTQNSCDPAMAFTVLWALNAISKRDITKPIKTTQGPWMFTEDVTTPITETTSFIFYFLLSSLLLRIAVDLALIARDRYFPQLMTARRTTSDAHDGSATAHGSSSSTVAVDPIQYKLQENDSPEVSYQEMPADQSSSSSASKMA